MAYKDKEEYLNHLFNKYLKSSSKEDIVDAFFTVFNKMSFSSKEEIINVLKLNPNTYYDEIIGKVIKELEKLNVIPLMCYVDTTDYKWDDYEYNYSFEIKKQERIIDEAINAVIYYANKDTLIAMMLMKKLLSLCFLCLTIYDEDSGDYQEIRTMSFYGFALEFDYSIKLKNVFKAISEIALETSDFSLLDYLYVNEQFSNLKEYVKSDKEDIVLTKYISHVNCNKELYDSSNRYEKLKKKLLEPSAIDYYRLDLLFKHYYECSYLIMEYCNKLDIKYNIEDELLKCLDSINDNNDKAKLAEVSLKRYPSNNKILIHYYNTHDSFISFIYLCNIEDDKAFNNTIRISDKLFLSLTDYLVAYDDIVNLINVIYNKPIKDTIDALVKNGRKNYLAKLNLSNDELIKKVNQFVLQALINNINSKSSKDNYKKLVIALDEISLITKNSFDLYNKILDHYPNHHLLRKLIVQCE